MQYIVNSRLQYTLLICCTPCIIVAFIANSIYRSQFPKKTKPAKSPWGTPGFSIETEATIVPFQQAAMRVSPTPLSTAMPRRRLSIDTIERDLAGDPSNSETEAVIGEVHVTDAEQVILGDEKPRQTAHDQMQSRLFQLPAELRWQIWEDVLGGYVFHILFVDAYRRMSHHRCKTTSPICDGSECRERFKVPGARDPWGNVSLLALPQTCRRIYRETIELLYTANTFEFNSFVHDVYKLSSTILPERMQLIRNVQWGHRTYNITRTNPIWLDCYRPAQCYCIACHPHDDDNLLTHIDANGRERISKPEI